MNRPFICMGILLFALTCSPLFAAVFNGEPIVVFQPDGTRLEVNGYGDRYFHIYESPDGYTLTRDPETGIVGYARLSPDGREYLSSGIRYIEGQRPHSSLMLQKHIRITRNSEWQKRGAARQRLAPRKDLPEINPNPLKKPGGRAGAPDTIVGLVLLIEFPDDQREFERDEMEALFNQQGYTQHNNIVSVRDWFEEVSSGQLVYLNLVADYYMTTFNKSEVDGSENNFEAMIQGALDQAVQSGMDLSSLTLDDRDRVRALNISFAGSNADDWLWPHMNSISTYETGGHTFRRYQVTGIGGRPRPSTLCHENGHLIMGWPDLYNQNIDTEDIMGFNRNPPQPVNPHYRIEEGWESPVEISTAGGGTVFKHPVNSWSSFRWSHPENENEFFLIEGRIEEGLSEQVEVNGMIIWHIDDDVDIWESSNNAHHYQVTSILLDEADVGRNYTFNSETDDRAFWWDGTPAEIDLMNIRLEGDTLVFEIGESIPPLPVTSVAGSGFNIRATQQKALVTVARDDYYRINLYNFSGTFVRQIWKGYLLTGGHQISLAGVNSGTGIHFLQLENSGHNILKSVKIPVLSR